MAAGGVGRVLHPEMGGGNVWGVRQPPGQQERWVTSPRVQAEEGSHTGPQEHRQSRDPGALRNPGPLESRRARRAKGCVGEEREGRREQALEDEAAATPERESRAGMLQAEEPVGAVAGRAGQKGAPVSLGPRTRPGPAARLPARARASLESRESQTGAKPGGRGLLSSSTCTSLTTFSCGFWGRHWCESPTTRLACPGGRPRHPGRPSLTSRLPRALRHRK